MHFDPFNCHLRIVLAGVGGGDTAFQSRNLGFQVDISLYLGPQKMRMEAQMPACCETSHVGTCESPSRRQHRFDCCHGESPVQRECSGQGGWLDARTSVAVD